MKICMVSLASLPCHVEGAPGTRGGAEAQTALLAEELAARGHEVTVVLTDYDEGMPRVPASRALRLLNAYHLRQGVPGFRFLPRWAALHRSIARAGGDIVLQMGASAATGQTAHACRRTGRLFVFATASNSDVAPWRVRLGPRDRRFYAYGLRHAGRIVTQHAGQSAELLKYWGLPSTPLPMGVRVPETVLPPAEPPTVLWLGNFRAVKRPDRCLALADRFPAARFVMIGGPVAGEQEVYTRAKESAASRPNVNFLGPMSDPHPLIATAWVLLNTSSVEGFPTTFLEAWVRGVPTVSLFDPDGVIGREHLGRVAADEDDLSTALGEMLGSRALRDALGANGRGYVSAHHAPGPVAARFEGLFEEALGP